MFYCNQTEHDIAYSKELEDLRKRNPNFSLILCVDQSVTDNWSGETGLIDEQKIVTYIHDFKDKTYYLCGPIPFMKTVESILRAHDVEHASIKREVF